MTLEEEDAIMRQECMSVGMTDAQAREAVALLRAIDDHVAQTDILLTEIMASIDRAVPPINGEESPSPC